MPKINNQQEFETQLNCCFTVDYNFYICYLEDTIEREAYTLKIIDQKQNRYKYELYNSWNKNKIPIQQPFCEYRLFNFKKIKFNETITI